MGAIRLKSNFHPSGALLDFPPPASLLRLLGDSPNDLALSGSCYVNEQGSEVMYYFVKDSCWGRHSQGTVRLARKRSPLYETALVSHIADSISGATTSVADLAGSRDDSKQILLRQALRQMRSWEERDDWGELRPARQTIERAEDILCGAFEILEHSFQWFGLLPLPRLSTDSSANIRSAWTRADKEVKARIGPSGTEYLYWQHGNLHKAELLDSRGLAARLRWLME